MFAVIGQGLGTIARDIVATPSPVGILFPHRSVLDNIVLPPPDVHRRSKEDAARVALEPLTDVRLRKGPVPGLPRCPAGSNSG